MNYPEISVVIPTYNNGPEITRAINSVLSQDIFTDDEERVEIIIINDKSDDNYVDNLLHLSKKHRTVKLIHNKTRLGPSAARNCGIRYAKGALIAFLDADDEWPADKVKTLLPFFNNKDTDVVGGKVKYIIGPGAAGILLRYEDTEQRLTHVHLGALLVRKALFEKGFYFDESLNFSEDVDWWFRLRENHVNIVLTEHTSLLYYVHGNNMSFNKSLKELQLLQVLHNSLQRRRTAGFAENIPQVADFRTQKENPLISIILPLYNGKAFIDRTLKSIIAQTYTNWELCIIDDGSTDGGAEFARKVYPQAKIYRQTNAGVAKARNAGIKLCLGELIAFIDQDDEWLPDKLQKQWALLKNNPYMAFVTCNQFFKFNDGVAPPDFFKEEILNEHRSLTASALVVRKHAVLTIGGFDEGMVFASDMDIVRRLRNSGFVDGNVNELLLYKWYHGGNESLDKPKNMKEILMVLKKQADKND